MLERIYDKFLSVIFSKLTPVQLFLTSVFAFALGFLPGFSYAPFLYILIITLVIILRINIGVFVVIFGVAKLLSYPLEGISFGIGQFLIDSFVQPLFKTLVNTPVVAYAGFDYYLVTGGLALALVLGVMVGVIIAKLYKSLVNKMSTIQAGSELYQKVTNNFFVKIATWIFFGKSVSKIDWVQIKKRRFLQPFRITGVILVVLIVVAVAYSPKLLEMAMVSNIIKQQLSKANGATVDYKSLSLDLTDTKLQITGLGAANPTDLNQDRFYAESISASLSLRDILTKHLVLDNVVVNGVSLNKLRETKGKLYSNTQVKSAQAITESRANIKDIAETASKLQELDLHKYMTNAKAATKVAQDIKKGVEILSNFSSSDEPIKQTQKQQPIVATQEAKMYGYANVRAKYLEDKRPMLTILNLSVKDYKDFGNTFDIDMTNISTNPVLLAKPTTLDVISKNNNDVKASIVLSNQKEKANSVDFVLTNLGDKLANNLNIQGVTVTARNATISGNGQWQFTGVNNATFNIPLKIELTNVDASFGKFKQHLKTLNLNGVLSGSIDNPRVDIDVTALDKMFDVNDVAKSIANQAGINHETARNLVNNTKINGKAVKDMNTKDIQNLASSFGVKFN